MHPIVWVLTFFNPMNVHSNIIPFFHARILYIPCCFQNQAELAGDDQANRKSCRGRLENRERNGGRVVELEAEGKRIVKTGHVGIGPSRCSRLVVITLPVPLLQVVFTHCAFCFYL